MGIQRSLTCPLLSLRAFRKTPNDYFFFGSAFFVGSGFFGDSGLTLSFRNFPGLKATVLLALIFTGSPVWGFLPVRAPR